LALAVAACNSGGENARSTNAAANASPKAAGNTNVSANASSATANQPSATPGKPKLNLNTASANDFLTGIPGMGNKMVREFEEYRPCRSIQQFRREIGKYVKPEQVAENENTIQALRGGAYDFIGKPVKILKSCGSRSAMGSRLLRTSEHSLTRSNASRFRSSGFSRLKLC
jgi:hypothetical protein